MKNKNKNCFCCKVALNDNNWYRGDKNFKPYPRFRCKRCSNLNKMWGRGVDRNFGPKEWDYLESKQEGYCAICGRHESEQKNKLSLDHDHKTGKVRGFICQGCNGKLGWFENRKEIILEYIGDRNNVRGR